MTGQVDVVTGWLTNYETALAAGMQPDAAAKWASERTLNTFPNYNALPAVLREFSKLGLVGSFIAFTHEVYRNTYWNIRYALREIGSGNQALQALRELCDAHRLLLVFDEVQTGCGRLGDLFAFQHFGVTPDILTLGKGLGGGVPISAVLAQSHCSVFEPGDQGGTYAGNPLMCAASLAVLDVLNQPDFLLGVRESGQRLRQGLAHLSERWGLGEVRGEGLLLALELGHARAAEVVQACRENGLLVNAARPHCLRFMPRLNSTAQEIDEGLRLLEIGLQAVQGRA